MCATQPTGKTPRHILFDLDGTLVDSVRITCAVIDAMLAARGVTFRADPAVARAMDAIGGEAMIAAVLIASSSIAAMKPPWIAPVGFAKS